MTNQDDQEPDPISAETMPAFEVIWQDETAAVVCKPSGVLTHNSQYAGPSEYAMLQATRDHFKRRVWMVHRLDRGTSGVLLIGFVGAEVEGWAEAIRAGEKQYLALVRGRVNEVVTVDRALKDHGGGVEREAVTTISPVAVSEIERASLVRCRLEHGRYHQARRHLNRAGHPVINDSSHGDTRFSRGFRERWGIYRLTLHAEQLRIVHPKTGEKLNLCCPLPPEMQAVAEEIFPDLLFPLEL